MRVGSAGGACVRCVRRVEGRGVGCVHEIGLIGVRGMRGVRDARGGLGVVPCGAMLRRVVLSCFDRGMAVPIGCSYRVLVGFFTRVFPSGVYRLL